MPVACDRLEESVELAATDAPRGLHNHHYMETRDIDDFKSINDTHGHDAGDSILRQLAARLRRNTHRIGRVCRIGGEGFVVSCLAGSLQATRQAWQRPRRCSR